MLFCNCGLGFWFIYFVKVTTIYRFLQEVQGPPGPTAWVGCGGHPPRAPQVSVGGVGVFAYWSPIWSISMTKAVVSGVTGTS